MRTKKFARFIGVAAAIAALTGASVLTVSAGTASASPASQGEIRSKLNNKCLEILGLNNNNGANSGAWDCWGGANQHWYWDGVQIRSSMNNKCLEILGLNNSNGANVGTWDCWGGANQHWYWDGDQIRSSMNNKCLEILGLNNNNGAEVGVWDCWGGANQKWYNN